MIYSNISIYIHWPFCLALCPYCDFNSHLFKSIDYDLWLKAYESELEYFAYKLKNKFIRSIYFGGGTPSLMKPFIVEKLIEKISNLAILSDKTEITLEANPTSYEASKFIEFYHAGINRVSIGVQSLQDDRLTFLGRKHSCKEALDAIESASRIYQHYSFDLIYATSQQSLHEWQEELKLALPLVRNHLSLYQLTIEKGTPFYKMHKNGQILLPSDDISVDMYNWTNQYLSSFNYHQYEISNYATKNNESVHNLAYWYYHEYLGIGPGAHSRLHNTDMAPNITNANSNSHTNINAVMMISDPRRWLTHVSQHAHGMQNNNTLSQKEVIEELIMMGTRLIEGISEHVLMQITGLTFDKILNTKIVKIYIEQNLVSLTDKNLRLTAKGLLFHSYLVPRMLL